jgi:hypothetical protein
MSYTAISEYLSEWRFLSGLSHSRKAAETESLRKAKTYEYSGGKKKSISLLGLE